MLKLLNIYGWTDEQLVMNKYYIYIGYIVSIHSAHTQMHVQHT